MEASHEKATEVKLADPPEPRQSAQSQWWPILMIVLPLACLNFALFPLSEQVLPIQNAGMLMLVCFAMIPAQGALLSIGLVFGSDSFLSRLVIHWCSVLFMAGSWLGGYWYGPIEHSGQEFYDGLVGICILPLLALSAQAPLWLLRSFGWQLTGQCPVRLRFSIWGFFAAAIVSGVVIAIASFANPVNEFKFALTIGLMVLGLAGFTHNAFSAPRRLPPTPSLKEPKESIAAGKVSIRDLIAMTAVVAVSLGLARVIPMNDPHDSGDFWVVILIVLAISSAASLLIILPMLWFFSARIPLWLSWLLCLGYFGIYWLIPIVLVASGILRLPLLEARRMIGLALMIGSFGVGIGAGLMSLRLHGVRLVRGR